MKKMILLLLLVPVFVMAQPTITFIPSDGVTLTAADVDSTLAANGLTRDSAFHAVSDAIAIGDWAFGYCKGLVTASFPYVTAIDSLAFVKNVNLTSIRFGTGFATDTEIKFGKAVFGDPYDNPPYLTADIDLFLGEYVLPLPDIDRTIWQDVNDTTREYQSSYVWKSITIIPYQSVGGGTQTTDILCIGRNMYYIDGVSEIRLYDIMGNQIEIFVNQEVLTLNNLPMGAYFLTYIKNNKIITKKIVKN